MVVSPLAVAVEDLDGDGDLDVALANSEAGFLVSIFFQTDARTFLPSPQGTLKEPTMPLQDGRFLTAGDLDADGDIDLAVTNAAGDSVSLFLQTRPGSFVADPRGPVTTDADDPFFSEPRVVLLADLDGGSVRNLTRSPDVDETAPHWAPDGERLAVAATPRNAASASSAHHSTRDEALRASFEGARIAVIDREGRHLFQVPGYSPDWMPPWR